MDFKIFIQNENVITNLFKKIRDYILNFLNKIKSFVLNSRKITKNSVAYSFPVFDLEQSLKKESYESSLNRQLFVAAGKLFEIECFYSIKRHYGHDPNNFYKPKNYEKWKTDLAEHYDFILNNAINLAKILINDAESILPCVNDIEFMGDSYLSSRSGRQDPADIKFYCRDDNSSLMNSLGFSVKHKFSSSKDEKLNMNIANFGKKFQIPNIENSYDFANFLNKLINEGHNTLLVIGGPKITKIFKALEKDFSPDPQNFSKLIPKRKEKVTIEEKSSSIKFKYGTTEIAITKKPNGTFSVYLRAY